MDKDSNIRTLDSSIFLKDGAFIRWQGGWHVFQGPFDLVKNENSPVVSIACQDFFGHQKQILKPLKALLFDTATWQNQFKPEPHSGSYAWQGPSRELYSKSFVLVNSQIQSGRWKKAVPISFDRSLSPLTIAQHLHLLHQVSLVPSTLIPYGFWKNGKGFIGLTPEILFTANDKVLTTMALAGTEKKQGPCQLLNDEKNLKEHQFVAQELTEKLARFGSVEKSGPKILELPTLYHLQTNFSVSLNENLNPLEVVEYLHPTSALGTAPYSYWPELEELPEQRDRGYFGSPVLFQLDEKSSVAIVALRQLQWNESQVFIGAGGGVVQESQEELEWHEILAKIESVKKLMGIS